MLPYIPDAAKKKMGLPQIKGFLLKKRGGRRAHRKYLNK